MGLIAYCSLWISKFSDKIRSFVENLRFPLPPIVYKSLEAISKKLRHLLFYLFMILYLLFWRLMILALLLLPPWCRIEDPLLSFLGLYHLVKGITQRMRKKLTPISNRSGSGVFILSVLDLSLKSNIGQFSLTSVILTAAKVVIKYRDGVLNVRRHLQSGKNNMVASTLSSFCCAFSRNFGPSW